jgi:hypothetical protein
MIFSKRHVKDILGDDAIALQAHLEIPGYAAEFIERFLGR